MNHLTPLLLAVLLLIGHPVSADVTVQVGLALQGAYDPASGLMRDDLRRKGYLPTEQPYAPSPFSYAGQEILHPDLLTASDENAITDWVLLELRDAIDSSILHAQQAVLLQRNGQLVNAQNGFSQLTFSGLDPGTYRLAIEHRNHLGVLSKPLFLDESGLSFDFRDASMVDTPAASLALSGSLALLRAGDVDADKRMIDSGPGNDSNPILTNVLTANANPQASANYRLEGYLTTDLNLDGTTLFAGPGNDLNLVRANVLLHPDNTSLNTNYVVHGSLPDVNRLNSALRNGNAALITDKTTLLDEAIAALEARKSKPALLDEVFGTEAIRYDPGNRTQLLNLNSWVDGIHPLIMGNQGKVLAMAGETAQARYAAFGSVPTKYFQPDSSQLDFQSHFKRLLAWLIKADSSTLSTRHTVATSFMSGDKGNFHTWISSQFPDWELVNCAVVAELADCYADADLIVTGWQGTPADAIAIRQALAGRMAAGTPVLYLHTWYEAYNDVAHAIAGLLNFSLPYGGNYWAKDAANWSNASDMHHAIWTQQGDGSIETLLRHFKAEDFAFDWQGCSTTADCSAVTGFSDHFGTGATRIQSLMNGLDKAKIDLFKAGEARWLRLLALLGDQYRQEARYPMDKTSTSTIAFLKSLFADYSVYNYRRINPVQQDMGNFSRSDFRQITPISKIVSFTSKRHFRAAGVYALPGQTLKVTRIDNSAVNTRISINSLRSAATHEFEKNGYKRPKFLQSPAISIANGETVSLTSPYGGPVQIHFDANDVSVAFLFEQVGEHPFWSGPDDDARFTQQLAEGKYDWAELVTPGFEVHSTLTKMRESLSDSKWGNAQALAAATMRYVHNFPHALAGFEGPGIDPIPEVHDFAATHGYTIENLDLVKHMNADQATCGYGCSGNPYDAYWAFSPVGHGDIHEVGHGLEKWRLRFAGWETHTMTNPYSYYTKSQYHKSTGDNPDCQSLPFTKAFNVLQASVNQADPTAYVKSNLWDSMGWSEGAAMFIQMMMAVEDSGALQNGWHLLPRLHIMEREFLRATSGTEAQWEAKRTQLGFSQYTLSAAKALNQNDWLLIAISYASGRDLRDYFDLWALPYSPEAGVQVAAANYPALARNFYISSAAGYCKGEGFDGAKLPVDGQQVWP